MAMSPRPAEAPPAPARARMGHNNPPAAFVIPTIEEQLDPVTLIDQYELDHAQLVRKRDELSANFEKFKQALGPGGLISNDKQHGDAMDFAKQCRDVAALAISKRDEAKRPIIDAGRAIDSFFDHGIARVLREISDSMKQMADVFIRAEAARKKRAAEADAAVAREKARVAQVEADRLEAEARRTLRAAEIEKAEAAAAEAKNRTQQADRADRQAAAPDATFSRARSSRGTVSNQVDNWVYEVVDMALVPREYLIINQPKVTATIKRADEPIRDIPGLRVWNDRTTRLY